MSEWWWSPWATIQYRNSRKANQIRANMLVEFFFLWKIVRHILEQHQNALNTNIAYLYNWKWPLVELCTTSLSFQRTSSFACKRLYIYLGTWKLVQIIPLAKIHFKIRAIRMESEKGSGRRGKRENSLIYMKYMPCNSRKFLHRLSLNWCPAFFTAVVVVVAFFSHSYDV